MAFHDSRRLGSRLALGTLFLWIVLGSAGCGSGSDQSAGNGSGSAGDTAATSSDAAPDPAPAASGDQPSTAAAPASAGVVRLTDKGCVQLEPHWVSVAPGQAVTWVNETKAAVTVHVDAGAFSKSQFVVQPGGRVTSGPAGPAKDYKVWTEPNACQGAPLGARGSGPGVAVETAAH